MKILFLSGHYPPNTRGGGELSTHYIAQGLRGRGHHVTVITSGSKREQVNSSGVSVVRLPLAFTAKPLLEQRHSRRLACQLRPIIEELGPWDIVHAHDFRTAQILSELGYQNSLVTARDYAQICGSTNNILVDGNTCTCSWQDVWHNHRVVEATLPRKLFRVWQYYYNINYRRSSFQKFSHQIFISRAQQAVIAQQQDLSGVRAQVIYNPIDREYLSVEPIAPKTRDLLYVGTVEDYKGVRLLLEAFHQLASQFPNIQLKIVGDGTNRSEYERLVAQWGLQYRVTFTGRVAWDHLRRVYDSASIVVAPHLWIEPFGRTVVEAMSRARIVVAANAGGPAEIIMSGNTGWLFERGSIADLCDKLRYALTLRAVDDREMRTAARQWVNDHLTPDMIAQQHEAVYEQILNKTQPA